MLTCIIDKTYSNYMKKSRLLWCFDPLLNVWKKQNRFQTFHFQKSSKGSRIYLVTGAKTAITPNPGTRYFMSLKVCRHWTRRICQIHYKVCQNSRDFLKSVLWSNLLFKRSSKVKRLLQFVKWSWKSLTNMMRKLSLLKKLSWN